MICKMQFVDLSCNREYIKEADDTIVKAKSVLILFDVTIIIIMYHIYTG